VEITTDTFSVDTVEETLKKTNLGSFKSGTPVNLERALLPASRMGGHFVLGHIDTLENFVPKATSVKILIKISFDISFAKYIIPVGSIAVDGISLTVAETTDDNFTVAIIPHTYKNTNLVSKNVGDGVNLEFDVLGKYVLNSINPRGSGKITEDWLKEMGF
jgi:riboflavin synthase